MGVVHLMVDNLVTVSLPHLLRKGTYHCTAGLFYCLDSATLIMLN